MEATKMQLLMYSFVHEGISKHAFLRSMHRPLALDISSSWLARWALQWIQLYVR